MKPEAKRTIIVTGAAGLIGWHLSVFLQTLADDVELIRCDRAQFNDDDFLGDAVSKSHAIVHLAGMNRGDEDEIVATNIAIAQRLVDTCRKHDCRPHIIYSSSTHVDGDTKYGYSKRAAGELIAQWAEQEDARYCNLVLPHVFGELGKPFYNSVVSTFAHQITHGETPTIQSDGNLNLLHAQEVAEIIWSKIEEGDVGEARPQGRPTKVSELLERLSSLHSRYQDGVIPSLDDPFDHRLFNVMRSYIDAEKRPIDVVLHEDERGDLFEAIRTDGKGQVFLSTSHPGITRGNHFHRRKVERFLVISGKAIIRLRKVHSDEIISYEVSGDQLQAIDIPTLHTHNITNVGDEPLVTLFWAGEHFDSDNSDTYFLPVEPVKSTTANA